MTAISVVLPTYNRLPRLKWVIHALENQTLPFGSFEVIVVSDGATDGTNDFLSGYSGPLNLRPVLKKNGGVATARNAGFHAAAADLILFLDDDVLPEPGLVARHLELHQQTDSQSVIIGPMLTPPALDLSPWVSWEQAMLEKQYAAMAGGDWEPTARQFYTGNTSLPRQLLIETDGFDPSFRRAEDVELAYRLDAIGIPFIFDSEAVGYHFADRSFESWLDIPYAYGCNDVIFWRDKGQTWLLPTMHREFGERNRLIQLLVNISVDHALIQHGAVLILSAAGRICHALKKTRLAQFAFSGIFNIRYFQGVADELGGWEAFFKVGQAANELDPIIDQANQKTTS